jgi:putative ABC transport system ATP-binding protein
MMESIMNEASMRAKQLKRNYQMGEVTVQALKGIDLELRPREFIAIMGPSGSGKSTLLHLLAGLDVPNDGTIELGKWDYSTLTDRDLTLLRRRKIGIVFQFFNLLPNLTALENVALPLLLDGQSLRQSHETAKQVLAWVGLQDREAHTADRLSGGEQQRVALARALVFQPDLILADEPTGNLDRASGEQVLKLFRRAVEDNGQTIVMVTHDPLAAAHADRVVFLSDGLVADEIQAENLSADAIARAQAIIQD